jgi:undecaprenyl-diphosphatase
MTAFHAIFLGGIQGLTEFLPISSSGHLILLPYFMGWPDQGIAFDIAAHLGSLIAVTIYFREDLRKILSHSVTRTVFDENWTHRPNLLTAILLGTLPVVLVGFFLYDTIVENVRSNYLIALTTITFGFFLWWADYFGKQTRAAETLSAVEVLLVGIAQAIALIPGTSRSGITLTACLFLGLKRQEAARFSFLLSIPVITLATLYEIVGLFSGPEQPEWKLLLLTTAAAAATAFACISFFMRAINRVGVWPFCVYRLLLGVLILILGV